MNQYRLSERIKIEELCLVQNSKGFDEEKWNDYYECWSSFRKVRGSEYISAKATNSEEIVTFTVRYCNKIKHLLDPGASKKIRIKYKEFYYNIEYVDDYENNHQWVDIKAKIIS